jgi:hypothetical protein
MHLINIKRLGAEINPYRDPLRSGTPASRETNKVSKAARVASDELTLAASDVQRIVDDFLRDFHARA